MAKRTISENRAISQTIDRLRLEGLEENRATAAAFRMFREGELDALIRRQRSIEEKTAQEVKVERMMIDDMVRRIRREKKRRRLLQAAIAGIVSKITG
tara:strand:- start:39 stop:332 length:294 start_codon:yes stop_codon:yes gene_type:complete